MNTLTASTLQLPALHDQPFSLADLTLADWIWVLHKLHKPNALQPRTFCFFGYQPRARHNGSLETRAQDTSSVFKERQCGRVRAGSTRALNRGCCDGQCCRLAGEAQSPRSAPHLWTATRWQPWAPTPGSFSSLPSSDPR